ncbi:hypothetical protein E0H75_07080 [Kribbella capetownensis]|uniref:Tetratricopeptide repeat protein n=1 Tax=Kribbella capetownensis TaxID=1572659 RepID=A0A4R0K2Y6_9ACTN|nr:hypothetical protein [Kribbella capetownensis]TCC53447.1 hypothetical protein E0H75_07080 [Kribbella capetownensis]
MVVDPTDETSVYRLAATLATLARDSALWSELAHSRRSAAAALLMRAGERAHANLSRDDALDPNAPAAQQLAALRALARKLIERLHDTLRARNVLIRYFRRDQRDTIGSLHTVFTKYGRPAQSRAMVHAAALSMQPHSKGLKKIKKLAKDPRSGWQVCYNLACYYTQQEDDAQAAIKWLETALTRPGVEELAGAWLAMDPDLELLHPLTRFELLRNSFATRPEES